LSPCSRARSSNPIVHSLPNPPPPHSPPPPTPPAPHFTLRAGTRSAMEDVWLDAVGNFLRGESWLKEINAFAEEHCKKFPPSDSDCDMFTMEQHMCFMQYQKMVEEKLEECVGELGGSVEKVRSYPLSFLRPIPSTHPATPPPPPPRARPRAPAGPVLRVLYHRVNHRVNRRANPRLNHHHHPPCRRIIQTGGQVHRRPVVGRAHRPPRPAHQGHAA
jgi:hypothetical protein